MSTVIHNGYRSRFSEAPLLLRAYIAFALAATILSFSGFFAPHLNAAMMPFTGWSALSLYMFTLFFAISAIFTPKRIQVYAVAALLGLAVIFGAFDTFSHTIGPVAGRPDFGNPYLMYSPWRPLFTIMLPAAWALLLLSPMMRRWVKNS